MPVKPPRPCRSRGCPALTRNTSGLCDAHESAMSRAYDRERGTRQARGYGAPWQRLRALVLAESPLCVECQRDGRITPATDVDHIVPLRQGGTNDRENLQPLCRACHSRKTASADGRWGGAGKISGTSTEGTGAPVLHTRPRNETRFLGEAR